MTLYPRSWVPGGWGMGWGMGWPLGTLGFTPTPPYLYPLLVNTPDLVWPLPTLDLHPSSIPVDTPISGPDPLLLHPCFTLPFHNPCP